MKKFISGFLTGALIFGFSAAAFAAAEQASISVTYDSIKVYVDGNAIDLKDANGNPVEPFIYQGTTYLPVRAIGNALGKEISWDNAAKIVYIGEQFQDHHNQIGVKYSTQWFDFTIKSIKEVSEYAGHKPDKGNLLIDVLITQTGTYDQYAPIGTFDFHIDGSDFKEYVYPMKPINDTMMPVRLELKKGQTVEYHMVYEVPKGAEIMILRYIELNDAYQQGENFIFKLNL